MKRLLTIFICIIALCSCKVTNDPADQQQNIPDVKDKPPVLDGNTGTNNLGSNSGLGRFGGNLEGSENDPIESTPENEDSLETEEDRLRLEDMRLFNEQIRNSVLSRNNYVDIQRYLDRGNRTGDLRSLMTFNTQVVYRYVLAEDFANYQPDYPYDEKDAPDWDTLSKEGYMVAYMDEPYRGNTRMLYNRGTVPIRLFWNGTDDRPWLYAESGEFVYFYKSDEGMFNYTYRHYEHNNFTVKEINLSPNISDVKWVHQAPYSSDPRYQVDGTEVILIIGFHICFSDVRIHQPFYRLITFNIDAIKANPQAYTYVIRNPDA